MRTFNPKTLITVAIVAVLVLIITIGTGIYFDYNAYKEIGKNFLEVFFTNLKVKITFQTLSFLIVFVISYVSIFFLKKNLLKIDSTFDFLSKKYTVIVIALIFSSVVSSIIQITMHEKYLLFASPTFTGTFDPVFNKDIGYFLFLRPFYEALFDTLSGIFAILFIGILILYVFLYARLGINEVGNILNEKNIMIHNIINLFSYVLVKVATYGISAEEMLYDTSASFTGAGFTNVTIWKLYYSVIPFVLVLAVVFSVILFLKKRRKLAVFSLLLYPATYIVFSLVAMATQTFYVKPSEVTVESPYISNNISYTREAYNLTKVKNDVFPISYTLSNEDLKEEHSTITNTRIIDYPSTLKAINQVQSIRNYYNFNDLDIVMYDIDGYPTAVGLAAREFNSENIADTTKSFINERLRFTHGYGVAAVRVNTVTSEGQPEFLVKNIPTESYAKELEIKEPRIYYGEMNNDYVIANSKYKELDYSLGDSDVEYSYTGSSGIKMTPFNKVLYSLYLRDFQLLISNYVDSDSRLLINKNVLERVKTVAPFLTVDSDPYIVIDENGRVKWVVNCYTVSENYPYSYKTTFMGERINYIRESAKAVVDAYSGEVKFYITDKSDPIIASYNRIYPSFFEKEDMPEGISSHLQYPEAMFKIQTNVYKRYHTDNPEIFYNKTDLWDIAKEKYQGEEQYVSPYYSIMTTFKEEGSLVLMIPYAMSGKQNLVGWIAVNCDKDGYGDMILYTFPKGENIYGTLQIENKIDNDPEISREMTLWGQGGSTVIRGNMLTIPVKNSLLYIEPVYISSGTQSSLPELKRVIVAYSDNIVMEETLEKALYKLFNYEMGKPEVNIPEYSETVTEEKNPQIVELYDKLKDSMQKGDWKTFGENFSKLEEEINKLR